MALHGGQGGQQAAIVPGLHGLGGVKALPQLVPHLPAVIVHAVQVGQLVGQDQLLLPQPGIRGLSDGLELALIPHPAFVLGVGVDQSRHIHAELLIDIQQRGLGILQHVVEGSGGQQIEIGIHAVQGGHRGHRVENIGLIRPLAAGSAVAGGGKPDGPLHHVRLTLLPGLGLPLLLTAVPGGLIPGGGLLVKAGEQDAHAILGVDLHPVEGGFQGDPGGLLLGIAIGPGGDGGEGDAVQAALPGQLQAVPIAPAQQDGILLLAGVDRAHGVDDVLGL